MRTAKTARSYRAAIDLAATPFWIKTGTSASWPLRQKTACICQMSVCGGSSPRQVIADELARRSRCGETRTEERPGSVEQGDG